MSTIVVVNGAYDWRPHFPGHQVHQTYIQRSQWLYDEGKLWIRDAQGLHRPDVLLWRLGAIAPDPMHRACLELIRLSGVPCVNPANVLLQGYDRLGMLATMKQLGLPVIGFSAMAGEGALSEFVPAQFPAVLKVGNLHGGLGKARAQDREAFEELGTLASLTTDYITCEPFVDYVQDVRCLAVGDRMWAMTRRSDTWRANVATSDYSMIAVPKEPGDWTRHAMQSLGADILGLDFLQTRSGEFVLLESNDIPGVLGFPREVCDELAACVNRRLSMGY